MRKTRKRKIVLLVIVVCLSVKLTMAAPSLSPNYDLIFSIDYNDASYADAATGGIVIRVKNHKARAVFTGYWPHQDIMAPDAPQLFICEAATGRARELAIPFTMPRKGVQRMQRNIHAAETAITIPELDSLTVNNSSVAPNGSSLRGFNGSYKAINFDKTYEYGILVGDVYLAGVKIDGNNYAVQLEDGIYKQCLKPVGGQQAGLTVHFIGWIVPAQTAPSVR